jgi:hypothetical protein
MDKAIVLHARFVDEVVDAQPCHIHRLCNLGLADKNERQVVKLQQSYPK